MTFRYDAKTKRAKITIYAGHDHLGRQRQRSKTWSSPNERQAKREAASHEATLRQQVEQRRERNKTLNGLIDDWQAIRDAEDSPATVRKRAGLIRRIRAALGPIRLDDLSAKHVDRWMADMRAELDAVGERVYSDTTIANHWSTLRAILRQGDRWDVVSTRPTTQARPPKRISNRRPTPPTPAAVRVLIDAARPDLRVAAMLGAYAGLRRGEVIALRWSDIEPGVIHVARSMVDVGDGRDMEKAPKWDSAGDVQIDTDLAAALAEHRQTLEQRAVGLGGQLSPKAFVTPRLVAAANGREVRAAVDGTVARPVGWLTLAWTRHATKHGAPGVHFHDLRHFYVTQAAAAGMPWPVIQRQVRHSKLTTTLDIYTHAEPAAAIEGAEAIRLRRNL